MSTDRVSALEKLVQLKANGTITQDEFEREKAKLLAGECRTTSTSPPVHRRLWFVVTLTCLLVTFWLALFILASGPVYRKKAGVWSPISNGARRIYAGFLFLWILALLAKAIFHPGDWEVQTPAQQTSSATQPVAAPTNNAQAATTTDAKVCVAPAIPNGTPYLVARARLIASGYEPHGQTDSSTFCALDPATCRQFPEIDDCSADGYCKMVFQAKNGATATVGTFGDGPNGDGATTLEKLTYSCQEKPDQAGAPTDATSQDQQGMPVVPEDRQ